MSGIDKKLQLELLNQKIETAVRLNEERAKLQKENEEFLLNQASEIAYYQERERQKREEQKNTPNTDIFQKWLDENSLRDMKEQMNQSHFAKKDGVELSGIPAMDEYLKLDFAEQLAVIDKMKKNFAEFEAVRSKHDGEINFKLYEFDDYVTKNHNNDPDDVVRQKYEEMEEMMIDEINLLLKEIAYLKEVKTMLFNTIKVQRDNEADSVKTGIEELEKESKLDSDIERLERENEELEKQIAEESQALEKENEEVVDTEKLKGEIESGLGNSSTGSKKIIGIDDVDTKWQMDM